MDDGNWIFLVCTLLGIVLLISYNFLKDWDIKFLPFFWGLLLIIGGLIGLSIEAPHDQYRKGQVDALKGKQHYEIHYVYRENDTIPLDTLFKVKEDKK